MEVEDRVPEEEPAATVESLVEFLDKGIMSIEEYIGDGG